MQKSNIKYPKWKVKPKITLRHDAKVFALALSPDENYLVSGSKDCTVRIWQLSNRKCLKVHRTDDGTNSICFSPDQRKLAIANDEIAIYNFADLKQPPSIIGGNQPNLFLRQQYNKIHYSRDSLILYALQAGIIIKYNENREVIGQIVQNPAIQNFNMYNDHLMTYTKLNKITMYFNHETSQRSIFKLFNAQSDFLKHLKYLITCDMEVVRIRIRNKVIRRIRLGGYNSQLKAQGPYLLVGAITHVTVIDLRTSKKIQELRGHTEQTVPTIIFTKNLDIITAEDDDNRIFIYETRML